MTDFPVTPKPAFYEWTADIRRDLPYVLGHKRWHIGDNPIPLCRRTPLARVTIRGTADDVTNSGIPLCQTCIRIDHNTTD